MQLNERVTEWLLKGDVSVQYQVHRDLLKSDKQLVEQLQQRIATEGWGKKLLSHRNEDGKWGGGIYGPKWTSTHYTLLLLRRIGFPAGNEPVNASVNIVLNAPRGIGGGINPERSNKYTHSDVCVNGMILYFSSYFLKKDKRLDEIADYLLDVRMQDGGWNCSHLRGAVHSSLHTTLSVLEGLHEYQAQGNNYRKKEIDIAREAGKEFILQHRLYRSDKTGNIIRHSFSLLSFPPRWYYDILKALDHFREAGYPYDERMSDALELLLKKRNKEGKWPLQGRHPGRVFFEMEDIKNPGRWNTLRAIRVLEHFGYAY